MAARRFLMGTLGSLAAAAAVALMACLDDLPAPTTCPPEPVYPGDNCVPGLMNVEPGCLDLSQMACLAGPRKSCTCVLDECPPPEAACYPEGDCPVEVTEAVGGSPECVHVSSKDVGAGLPSEAMCLCGCAGCVAVCDGKGPVLGIANDGNVVFAPLTIDIAASMPDSGRIGVFLRERGVAGAVLAVMKGKPGAYEFVTYYYISSPIGTEYTTQVLYDDPFLGTTEYEWDKAADKPTLLAIFPGEGMPGMPQLNLMEIDCVVPFVVPR